MIKVFILDTDTGNLEKISAVFTSSGALLQIKKTTNPSEVLNELFLSGIHILVFPKSVNVALGLSMKSIIDNLKSTKAPTITLVTNNLFNKLETIPTLSQINFCPEVPTLAIIKQAVAYADSVIKSGGKAAANAATPQNSAQQNSAPKASQADAGASSGSNANPAAMDPAKFFTLLMNLYVDSMSIFFEELLGTKPVRESLFVRNENDPSGDVSSVISITNAKMVGSIAISFKSDVFFKVASKFMSEDIQSLNDDTKDILTEIISEINEKFQVKVKEQKIEVNQALPMILVGPNHKIKHGSSGKIVCVKFGLLNSSFSVEFVVQSKA